MSKSLKDFKKVGRNKHTRKLLAKQKELSRGRYSSTNAMLMSKEVGRPMPYMYERDDIKSERKRIGHAK